MAKAVLDFKNLSGVSVGIKVAGGIRDAKDAIRYLVLIQEEMGNEWLTPDLFRFGASSLLDDVLKQIKKDLESFKKSNIDPRAFVILDDCLFDDKWTRDKMMRLLFMNGRHWKIMLIITMQYPLGIPPTLRTNIDYVFILREPYIANRRRIYEN